MFIAYIRMKKKCCSVFICSHSTRARAHAHIHKYSIENVVVVVVVVIAVAAKVTPGTPFTIYETHFKKYIPKRVQQQKKLTGHFPTHAWAKGGSTHSPNKYHIN